MVLLLPPSPTKKGLLEKVVSSLAREGADLRPATDSSPDTHTLDGGGQDRYKMSEENGQGRGRHIPSRCPMLQSVKLEATVRKQRPGHEPCPPTFLNCERCVPWVLPSPPPTNRTPSQLCPVNINVVEN